jgi:hypothetical protein
MLLGILSTVLAFQIGAPAPLPREGVPLALEIRHRRHGHPSPQSQSGGYFPLEYGNGRPPVPCGDGADLDIRDGLCYPTGTVPRRWQQGRLRYQRRDGYYVLE